MIEDVAASWRFWASKCGMAFRRPVKKTTLWGSPNNFGLAFNGNHVKAEVGSHNFSVQIACDLQRRTEMCELVQTRSLGKPDQLTPRVTALPHLRHATSGKLSPGGPKTS